VGLTLGEKPTNPHLVFDLFLLSLIGMGPKIVLVTFLDATKGVEPGTRCKAANTLARTVAGTALPHGQSIPAESTKGTARRSFILIDRRQFRLHQPVHFRSYS
jgi:hypothetical protein